MIGKAKWFTRRRYTGWGIMPKTWQGVIYFIVAIGIFYLIQKLPIADIFKILFTAVAAVVLLIDILSIMASIKLDEREAKIEAIAERNASWTMVATLAILALYFSVFPQDINSKDIIFILISPVAVGVVVKAASNFILDQKGI